MYSEGIAGGVRCCELISARKATESEIDHYKEG